MDKQSGKLTFESSFSEAKFERDKNLIRNVVLLGPVSKNNRHYTPECMRKAVSLFEGVQAFINHPSIEEEKTGRRDVRNLAGKYVNARLEEGKVKADAMLLPGENGKLYMDIAESMPDIAGNSQNAAGRWRNEGGKQIVEELTRVMSVDLVANPATTGGMFESDESTNNTGDNNMEWKDVSRAMLLENRKDVFDAVIEEGKKARDEEVKKLVEERDSLKKKADEYEVREAVAKKKELAAKVISEAKLPKEAVTDVFTESVMGAADEAGMKKIVEDRKKLYEAAKGGVRNMGGSGNEGSGSGKDMNIKEATKSLLG